jgi:hypothetical protein
MPGPVVNVGATATCPHGGMVTIVSSNARVLATGMPLATMADQFMVAGCAFTVPPGVPQPCLRLQWMTTAVRVLINGQPPILQASTGIALSATGVPGGPPIVATTQMRVVGT